MEIQVNDRNFENEVIEQSKKTLIVVDFWADWCGPCVMLGPIMEKLAKEYDGKFILAKLDVQANQLMAEKYNIRSIPCVKFFKNKKVVGEFIGALSESEVREWLEKNI